MENERQRVHLRVDLYTRVCLTVIAALLTVLIVGLWADGVPSSREAIGSPAGIPDSGQQRERIIKEIQKTTAKLDRLIGLFEGGTEKVQIADGPAAGGKRAPTVRKK